MSNSVSYAPFESQLKILAKVAGEGNGGISLSKKEADLNTKDRLKLVLKRFFQGSYGLVDAVVANIKMFIYIIHINLSCH